MGDVQLERIWQSRRTTDSLTRLLAFCYHLPHEHDATLRAATPGIVAVTRAVFSRNIAHESACRGPHRTQVKRVA